GYAYGKRKKPQDFLDGNMTPRPVTAIEDAERRLREMQEQTSEAIKILNPNMPESGLLDACRQVKQVAISEADNSEKLEAEVLALRAQIKATWDECWAVSHEVQFPLNDIRDIAWRASRAARETEHP
ncbi:MAG: hypothetical protein WAY02_07390, partial [Burkholderiaceae bacterium]